MSVRNKRHQREFYALIEPICGSVICSVTVRFSVSVYVRVRAMVRVRVADCCMQTAGQSDKMRISHVIKTDQWRSDPRIRSAPHFVVFPSFNSTVSRRFAPVNTAITPLTERTRA